MLRSKFSHNICRSCICHVPKRNYEFSLDKIPQPPEEPTSFMGFVIPRKPFGLDLFQGIRKNIQYTPENMQRMRSEYQHRKLMNDQRFIYERHKILGANLATAHFVVARGGAVKFHGDNHWIRKEPHEMDVPLPSSFVPNYYLEAVDFSNSNVTYEGLDNFVNLFRLTSLNLSNCLNLDDWCLDRMHQFPALEHLDISGCQQVTERGVCALTKLRNLKSVNLSSLPKASNIELVSILLEDSLPECKVQGVNYLELEPKYLDLS